MPAAGDVWVESLVFLISFAHVGQRRASKAAAVINSNVASNWLGSVDTDDQADKIQESMTTDDYKVLIKSRDVLDRGTLITTIEELERIDETRLTIEVKRIVAHNKIENPTLHNNQDDLTT